MILRSSLVFASLLLPLAAQESGADSKGSVASFYKAYFLDKEDTKDAKATAEAIGLYTAFIAENKDHKLASRAAANCVVLLYATGAADKADAFAKEHGTLLADAEAKDAAGGTGVMGMMRGFGRGGRGGQAQENPNQATVDKLMALYEKADDTVKVRLRGAITRLGGTRDLMMQQFRGMGGNRGGGLGGARGGRRGGGFTKPKIAEMSKEDAKKAVDSMVATAERMIDRMASNGQADQADALEAKLDKIQDLVDDGKMAEAQKVIDSIEVGGAAGGRGQGGRRRRGGEEGGAGGAGGERRRRGGDTGGGEAGGERRRRG